MWFLLLVIISLFIFSNLEKARIYSTEGRVLTLEELDAVDRWKKAEKGKNEVSQ